MCDILFLNGHSNALVKAVRPLRVPTGFKAVVTSEASDPYWETYVVQFNLSKISVVLVSIRNI